MRLLTRADFDGFACAVLLKELGVIDAIKFVHPKDMQDGLVAVSDADILANVPYVPGCKMWFDHHASEKDRLGDIVFAGVSRPADSAARVIFEYYNDPRLSRFGDMITYVDKVDSAKLTIDEIRNPAGWVLLGLIMDPRTGLGRFRDFRLGNFEFVEMLIDFCRSHAIAAVMDNPDVRERVAKYREQDALFRDMVTAHTRTDGNVIVSDLRGVETIYTGNRFLIYSLYPEQNISIWVVDGRGRTNCPIAVGHSILNRTAKTDVGKLMLKYGGGGHSKVGTCQVAYDDSDKVIAELVAVMKRDG